MSKGSTSSIINSSTWSSCSSDNDTSILAKLRRLKIQEGVILQNVHKTMLKNYNNGEDFIMPCASLEYKSYVTNLRKCYSEIKDLFESVKCNTTSDEVLKTYDIDDIKNDVLALETKIKKFKNILLSDQTSLKAKELELITQMDGISEALEKTTKQPKIKIKPFSDIVPSPVKNIISFPFKCQEVQKFQEFLQSHQRYGGWNEYSHNMFTQSWLKHFHNEFESNLEIDISEIEKSNGFINDIVGKIPGVTKEDIIQHSKWYLEYLHLKRHQQEALNKWRAKKKLLKKLEKGENGNIKKGDYHIGEKPRKCIRRVNDVVSDEMKRIEEMFSVDLLDDSIFMSDKSNESSLRHSRSAADGKEKGQIEVDIFLNRPTSTREFNLKIEKRRGLFNFAKSTQQWTNMCNDKKSRDSTLKHIPQLEDIGKLCVPKWRSHINNQPLYS